ncbi:glycerol-3-phosphate ABC transporter substrate-binding protein [Bacillus manliponensis]|uniref:Glycerol-3-phosphate ABC transporter substrate-binding protein n=1 Tax=Bacillus manliponensis TaxID=574376 RepID=A0A073JUU7_9BACI|nr:ABC transporter substrate-binding protein [Bacillus manliponensis]KEK18085.1 glycerol-3-phosphate ABC transporter substrate-binding protein [Bacillus manliponensis]
MKFWKKSAAVMMAATMALSATACSSSKTEGNAQREKVAPVEKNGDKTVVRFWHAMGGNMQTVLDEIVSDYNNSQDKYEIKPEFQGTYEESLTKFKNMKASKEAPALVQSSEITTKYMIDSKKITPIHSWIEKDNYDTSKLEKAITNYYSVDGKMYSMPFNSSTPVLIYNKDAFTKAGLDPEKAPRTYEELKEAAKKLTIKEGDSVKQYGFSMLNYGWFFEELLATQGGLYVDKENGRKGAATKAVFNGEEGQKVFGLLDEMNKAGTLGKYGSNWDDIRAAFQSQQVAMYLDSSAGVRDIVDSSQFNVGVAYLPHPKGVDPNGVVVGGASLWMTNMVSEETQQGAWDFMKYLTEADVQAKWHTETGYFSINPEAYSHDLVKQQYEKYPQLKVTVEQLQATKSNVATQGALITVFPESRDAVVKALEAMYEGKDSKEALDEAAKATDRAISISNRTNGK